MPDIYAALNIRPAFADRTVFKYLQRAEGAHALRAVPRKVLLACSSRSGSTLVKECLRAYDVMAREYFNVEGFVKPAAERGDAVTIVDYANHLARTAVRNDTFAIKGDIATFLFLHHIGELPAHAGDWRVVFIRRSNIVRQAISMHLARITGQWSSAQPPLRDPADGDYSFDAISGHIEGILKINNTWEGIFALVGVEPLRVFYEDFDADIPGETYRVARFIGWDGEQRAVQPRIARQSTALNDAWERRFTAESCEALSPRE